MEDLLATSRPEAIVDIIHHDVAALRSLGRVLSVHGYRVCMFTSAEEYRRTVEQGKALCVVIDLGLRGVVSGLDLGRAVMSSRQPTPVVFIAPSVDAELWEQAFVMGCAAYLEEPVTGDMLISAIVQLSPS